MPVSWIEEWKSGSAGIKILGRYRGRKEGGGVSDKEGEQILAWLPEREHRVGAANGFDGERAL